ncbi:unnamed protein product [Lupinus luteus]|uniref:Dirigent protein n=1 Tax=Lupinus luteus TaxID=3873 RepID=A0AAV1Y4D2_LUPLU
MPHSTKFLPSFLVFLLFFFFISFSYAKSHTFSKTISPSTLGLNRHKLSHLHFYFHDVIGGRNQTAVRVAASPATSTSPTGFGSVVIMDDPLTEQPEWGSKEVGRAQGIYASASQTELGFLMVLNFAFTQGRYNGSSLSIVGRNTVASAVREMPVVGGSGVFRFAHGYAHAKTYAIVEFEAVVEYNVYVFHY